MLIFSNEGVENAGVVEQLSWKIFTLMPQLLLHYIGHRYMPTCSRRLAYNVSCTCTCMVYVFSLSVLACNLADMMVLTLAATLPLLLGPA